MRQFLSTLAVTVMAASVTLAGCGSNAQAQDNGGAGGGQGGAPNPALRAAMEKVRTDTQTSTMSDLSADHRAEIQKIIDGVNNGTDTDFAGDVTKIDGILTPVESKAVLGERDKMTTAMKAAAAQNGGGAGGAGGGRRGGGGMMRSNDPGRFVLYVNLSRERMRAIRQAMQQRNGGGSQ
ncbi:MAG: hypothetical protein ABR975_07920 [Vulcanimicrobiaceae bacterium]